MNMASPAAKFLALASFFLVLLSLAHGAIYRTVVTTTETITDDERGPEEESCSDELQRHSFGSCRSYLQQQEVLTSGNQQQGRVPQQCCEQMRNVRDDCTCYVLRRMVEEEEGQEQEQEGQGGGGYQQGEMLRRRALQIPSECHLKTGSCEISAEI